MEDQFFGYEVLVDPLLLNDTPSHPESVCDTTNPTRHVCFMTSCRIVGEKTQNLTQLLFLTDLCMFLFQKRCYVAGTVIQRDANFRSVTR